MTGGRIDGLWVTGKSVDELTKVDTEAVALGCRLEVHVAEKAYADALRRALRDNGAISTTVLHAPAN